MTTAGRKELEALKTRPRLPRFLSQASSPPRGPSSAPSSPRSSQRDGPNRPTRRTDPLCPASQPPLLLLLPAGTTLQKYHNPHLLSQIPPFAPNPSIPDRRSNPSRSTVDLNVPPTPGPVFSDGQLQREVCRGEGGQTFRQ